MGLYLKNSQSQRPIVIEEEGKREEEDLGKLTKEELQEVEEIREKEVMMMMMIMTKMKMKILAS